MSSQNIRILQSALRPLRPLYKLLILLRLGRNHLCSRQDRRKWIAWIVSFNLFVTRDTRFKKAKINTRILFKIVLKSKTLK
jgi:hypothetical protein